MKTEIILRLAIDLKLKLFLKNWIRTEIVAKPKRKLKLWTH